MKFEDVRRGYAAMWQNAKLRPERASVAVSIAAKLLANKARYEVVTRATGVPWWWIAAAHQMESGANFSTHLHNGDPLVARTSHVPAGRPTTGEPPFTWQSSAIDALTMAPHELHLVEDWSPERALWEWERYNGLGYFKKKINSPYVWSFTTHYTRGKYVADGKFDPDAVSEQCGTAAILLALIQIGAVTLTSRGDPMKEIVDALSGFKQLVPALAAAAGGPMAVFAVRALAEALDTPDATADQVREKLETTPLTKLVAALQAAENLITTLAPTPAPTPIVIAPPPAVPAAGPLDNLFGGEFLKGWKTFIGGALFVLLQVIQIMGIAPQIFTPQLIESLLWVAGLLAGTGLIAKLERIALFFKKPPTSVIVTQTSGT